MNYTTKAACELSLESDDQGPPSDLEHYYRETGDIELAVSTDEREEYERDTGAEIESDVLPDADFDKFVEWLKENADGGLHDEAELDNQFHAKRRLEEAAPELLAACREQLDDYRLCDQARLPAEDHAKMGRLMAAIAKAEGRQP